MWALRTSYRDFYFQRARIHFWVNELTKDQIESWKKRGWGIPYRLCIFADIFTIFVYRTLVPVGILLAVVLVLCAVGKIHC